jgi:TatA/E family protein of Tat protein translocase
MFGFGHGEILVILVIILLVFGAKRIPEMAQGLGRGIREFRGAVREVQEEISEDDSQKQNSTMKTTPDSHSVPQGESSSKQDSKKKSPPDNA